MSKIPSDTQWADLVSRIKEKANSSDLATKADVATTYTKTEVDAAIAAKGSARELTTADYNYDEDGDGIKDTVALWLLPSGLYYSKNRGAASQIPIRFDLNGTIPANQTLYNGFFIFDRDDNRRVIVAFNNGNGNLNSSLFAGVIVRVDTNGGNADTMNLLGSMNIRDNLTTTSAKHVLSANQGRVLNEKIESRIIAGGTTAPTTETVGSVGALYAYVENGTGHLAICTVADDETPTYTWSTLV